MSPGETCHVCGKRLSGRDIARCGVCDRRFHLRVRADAPGVDCGEVRINEQFLAMEFTCRDCLGGGREPPVGASH